MDQVEIRKDLLGKEPEIGSFIAYNPPRYKGLKILIILGFQKSGLPIGVDIDEYEDYLLEIDSDPDSNWLRVYGETPKTGFVIVEDTLNKIQ